MDNLTEYTPEQLVDLLGIAKAERAIKEKREKEIRDALVSRGLHEVEGNLFRATIVDTERMVFDTKKIRATMPTQWLAKHTLISRSSTVKVTSK